MEIIKSFKNLEPLKSSVLTVGNYDGIHLGHQDVINYIVEFGRKNAIPSCVITFDPNPYYILRDEGSPINIQNTESKLKALEKMGVDKCQTVSYFGFKKEGNLDFLVKFCSDKNIDLFTPETKKTDGRIISSTEIRMLIRGGKLDIVPSLLGRFYGFKARVVHGSHRGKSLNYPTANFVAINKHQVLPQDGVYFSRVTLEGEKYFGMCNIGFRPTFNEKKFVMEVHILSNKFSDLYDKNFYIDFLLKIRDEKKFDSKETLVKQIEKDKEVCIKLIDSSKENYEI